MTLNPSTGKQIQLLDNKLMMGSNTSSRPWVSCVAVHQDQNWLVITMFTLNDVGWLDVFYFVYMHCDFARISVFVYLYVCVRVYNACVQCMLNDIINLFCLFLEGVWRRQSFLNTLVFAVPGSLFHHAYHWSTAGCYIS